MIEQNVNGAVPPTAPSAPAPMAAPAGNDVADRLQTFERQTSEMQRQLAVMLEENKALKDESAQRRIAARDAELRAAEASAKAGDVEALKRAYETRLTEAQTERERLMRFEPAARAWEQHEQAETMRVTERAKVLPPHFAVLLDGVPTLDGKRKVLAAYEAEQAARMALPPPVVVEQPKQPAPFAPPGGAPAGTPPPQLSLETATVEQLQSLRAQDPGAFARLTRRGGDALSRALPDWATRTLKTGP